MSNANKFSGFIFFIVLNCALGSNDDSAIYLLPGDIKPIHYDLKLKINNEEFLSNQYKESGYYGKVDITMIPVKDSVKDIVVNSGINITILHASLKLRGSSITLGGGDYDMDSEKLTFNLEKALERNESVLLSIEFKGVILSQNKGFYRTTYIEDGEEKTVLNTSFEPVFARTALPCFDEPRYKATFNISVYIPSSITNKGFTVLSNTELINQVNTSDGLTEFTFKKTPVPMSTYLIGIVIADFRSTPPQYFESSYFGSPQRKEFRTWGMPSVIHDGDIAQDVGVNLMNIYTKDYGIGYAFNKVDQVAIPYFRGGMEDWGVVLYNADIITKALEKMVANVILIGHELAHQWFGNLVTCHWWSDLWLNEGFATYFGYFGSQKVITPIMNASTWKLPHQFVVLVQQKRAFQIDIPGKSHPMTHHVYSPADIILNFDNIEYTKSAAVIRMWSHILGADAFDKALQLYLNACKEDVGTPETLLSSFDQVTQTGNSVLSKKLPSKVFKCWHLQEGYPVVQVKSKGDHAFILTQEPFRYRGNSPSLKLSWYIPISYSTNLEKNFSNTQPTLWIDEHSQSQIELNSPVDWIILNNQQAGYYRVNYELNNWKILLKLLENEETAKEIHEINRAQIIDDAANLARSAARDYLEYSFFMKLTLYLENEKNYFPWLAALNNFEYLNAMLSKDQLSYDLFKKHILKIMQKPYSALTSVENKNDSFEEKELRSQLILWSCKMGIPHCLQRSKVVLASHLNNSANLSDSMLSTIYCAAATNNDKATQMQLWTKYLKSRDETERANLVSGLTCSGNEEILNKLLQRSISADDDVSSGERQVILRSISYGIPKNIKIIFQFVIANYMEIYKMCGGSQTLGKILLNLADSLGTDEELFQMKALISSIKNTRSSKPLIYSNVISEIMEIVETNNEWLKTKSRNVRDWLLSQYGSENNYQS